MIESNPSLFRVPARYYSPIVSVLLQRGLDPLPPSILKQIPFEALNDETATISLSQVESLVDALLVHVPRAELAFAVGKQLKISSHGMLGRGIFSSPTVGYALRLVCRYFSLIMPLFELRQRQVGQTVEIEFSLLHALSPSCLEFHLEIISVAWQHQIRELLSSDVPNYDLYLAVGQPHSPLSIKSLEEASCHFGQIPDHISSSDVVMKIVFPKSAMELALELADPSVLEVAEQRCAELVHSAGAESRLVEWIKLSLSEAKDELPTQKALAGMLNISTRTLDRSLRSEGLTFRKLANKIRFQRACDSLINSQLTVLEIALELGYSDSSNFTRAFHRQAGCSPSQWRESSRSIKPD